MDTLNEYIYDTYESIRPHIKDDESVDERYIRSLIHNQRELWIRNDAAKNRRLPESIIQDLGCVELEKASDVECCDYSSECKVLRTKLKIPRPVTLNNAMAITYVGPLASSGKAFKQLSHEEAKYFGNGRFSSKGIGFEYKNDRLFLVSKELTTQLLEKISVRLVAVNPEDVIYFNHCSGDPCYSDDMTYPIIGGLWPFMKEQIINTILSRYRIPEDTVNDGRDQTVMNGK